LEMSFPKLRFRFIICRIRHVSRKAFWLRPEWA
jgi:hypothetical protein